MRILVFSAGPHALLQHLSEYFSHTGHEVISVAGKGVSQRNASGIRRIILNFSREEGQNPEERWKTILRNGRIGAKALSGIASAWQPDVILCSAGLGGAFFIRDVYPAAFMAAFASDHNGHKPGIELDCRLFLESQLRFAPDKLHIRRFPALMQAAIRTEPICIDANFFAPGKGEAFTCWKFDSSLNILAITLTGLGAPECAAWSNSMARFLAGNPDCAIVALMDRSETGAKLLYAISTLPGALAERLFVADHIDDSGWRNLCRTAKAVVFTSASQKKTAMQCVAGGGVACATKVAGLAIPGLRLLSGRIAPEKQLAAIVAGEKTADLDAIREIRQAYGCEKLIPEFAAGILAACKAS